MNIYDVNCGPGHGFSIGGLAPNKSEAHVSEVTISNSGVKDSLTGVRIKTWQVYIYIYIQDLDHFSNKITNPIKHIHIYIDWSLILDTPAGWYRLCAQRNILKHNDDEREDAYLHRPTLLQWGPQLCSDDQECSGYIRHYVWGHKRNVYWSARFPWL